MLAGAMANGGRGRGQSAGGPSQGTLKRSQSTSECRHPCVYQYGSCSFGDDCRFADVDGRVCAKYLKGNCAWGMKCCWKHPSPEELPDSVRDAQLRRSGQQTGGRRQGHEQPAFCSPHRPQNSLRQDDVGWWPETGDVQEADWQSQFQFAAPVSQGPAPPDLLVQGGGMPAVLNAPPLPPAPSGLAAGVDDSQVATLLTQQLADAMERLKVMEDHWGNRLQVLQQMLVQNIMEKQQDSLAQDRNLSIISVSIQALLRQIGSPLGLECALPFGGADSAALLQQLQQQQQTPVTSPASAAAVDSGYRLPKPKRSCHHCGKSGPGLQLCSGCRRAAFCGVECQKASWESHRQECMRVDAEQQPPPPPEPVQVLQEPDQEELLH
eukprot:TRINITY_DN830_c0_g1_i11.p1 TRINITY_DN830_c0_g1~~TRINITY_DN830_c0_g1_i11.p1  ORF type:complete len:380 (+),score=87.10 TRINITY_DN830_c0_g1_i11:80-1219(+)